MVHSLLLVDLDQVAGKAHLRAFDAGLRIVDILLPLFIAPIVTAPFLFMRSAKIVHTCLHPGNRCRNTRYVMRIPDVTGDFCTSGSGRESHSKERWYADQEVQTRTDHDAAAPG